MTKLSQALRDQIMSPIGRPISAIGVRPILREPALDIPGERNIFEATNPFVPPIPPQTPPPARDIRNPLGGFYGDLMKKVQQQALERAGQVTPPFTPPVATQPLQTGGESLTINQPVQQSTVGVPTVGQPLEKMPLPPKRSEFMSIGGPGGGFDLNERGVIDSGVPVIPPTPSPVLEPVIQPTVTNPTTTTEPVTTVTDTAIPTEAPVAPIDPVLMQQSASEVMSDPLLRSLYFGTADSPGFYNQLQQAGANLIASDVPLQQTAGLTPLELLARQQAVAGLGGFEPFLQQNRDLVNQAIQQSRRAEQLQDPYYTQAEQIYQDTMGAYDPSMTQQFYNPFEDAVVQQTIEDVIKAGEQQDIAARAREISSGAFGGSRARLGAEERRQDLGEGLARALSNIRSQGFQTAQTTGLSEFARQQQAKRTGAQGLMGIGVGRGSAAADLGQQLARFGGQLTGLGRTQEELRRGQRGELAGFGGIGRGIAETGLSRIYDQMLAQQFRPMQTLQQIGGLLPGYQASSSRIDSQYGMPTDPAAAGLGAAFSAYGAVAPKQGSS